MMCTAAAQQTLVALNHLRLFKKTHVWYEVALKKCKKQMQTGVAFRCQDKGADSCLCTQRGVWGPW